MSEEAETSGVEEQVAGSAAVGIDTGGTFTDLVAIGADGSVRVAKAPSSPEAPLGALLSVLDKAAVPGAAIERIVHGTTVATNAVLQRRGAEVLYLTTAGFEDIPFIQRINRKSEYDLHWLKPRPLVRRRNCLPVAERVDARGEVVMPLETAAMERLATQVAERAAEAIAVCLLFSYLNPVHELQLGAFLERRFPGIPVSLSHRVAPLWREYERSSTTLADAYLKPLLSAYCPSIGTALRERSVNAPCSLLKSDGGTTGLAQAPERPVELLLSGLAGGVIGGAHFAREAGFAQAITLDMGGTSCDVGLLLKGEPQFTTDYEIEWGLPVALPVIEVRTLGAGGGSIARIDKGGMLAVGPESAGARPGPGCYGAGGDAATVTDANLVLGRLNPDFFLGGELRLHPERAAAVIDPLARALELGREAAAQAIVDLADENMTNAIRLLTIERGIDPRDFVLVAFGGAGPLHAAAIAAKLGIRRVVVPPHPGLCSAFGAALARLRVERVRTLGLRHSEVDEAELAARFRTLLEEGRREIEAEGLRGAARERLGLSMRYAQQNYEQDVEYRFADGLPAAVARFHRRHEEFFGYQFPDQPVELVHLKASLAETAAEPAPALAVPASVAGTHPEPLPAPATLAAGAAGAPAASPPPALTTPAADVAGALPAPAAAIAAGVQAEPQLSAGVGYRRDRLPAGTELRGPAVVEELDSTTFVPDGVQLAVDRRGNLILTLPAGAPEEA